SIRSPWSPTLPEGYLPNVRLYRCCRRSGRLSTGWAGGDEGEDVVGGDLLGVLVLDGDVPADLAVGLPVPGRLLLAGQRDRQGVAGGHRVWGREPPPPRNVPARGR